MNDNLYLKLEIINFINKKELMEEIIFNVEGMNCNHCVNAVEIELQELNLISYNVEIGKVTAKFDKEKSSEELIKNAITEAGYRVL